MITGKGNRRNILFTFDYELFLGDRSGTVDNCLIIPTNEILSVLSKHNAKSVFFIDTIYLYRLKNAGINYPEARKDYEKIIVQLLQIAEAKHYVFHHLHPHWLDSVYLPEINQWNLNDHAHYAFASLSEDDRSRVFRISRDVMEEIFAGKSLVQNGFRAGGLYIQPFDVFKNEFQRSGIEYDFSVLPGFKGEHEFYKFNFTLINETMPYHFNDDVFQPVTNGPFMEFPISTVELKGFLKIINSLRYRLERKKITEEHWGDGVSSKSKIFTERKNSWLRTTETISVELLTPIRRKLYQRYLKHHVYEHMISHPKLISKSQLKVFDLFLETISRRYSVEYDFIKFTGKY